MKTQRGTNPKRVIRNGKKLYWLGQLKPAALKNNPNLSDLKTFSFESSAAQLAPLDGCPLSGDTDCRFVPPGIHQEQAPATRNSQDQDGLEWWVQTFRSLPASRACCLHFINLEVMWPHISSAWNIWITCIGYGGVVGCIGAEAGSKSQNCYLLNSSLKQ